MHPTMLAMIEKRMEKIREKMVSDTQREKAGRESAMTTT